MSSATSGEYWLISVPGEKGANDAWDKLNRSTGNTSTNSKYLIPDLKVGTLDQLVGLSDDLSKLDTSAEAVIRKLVQYFTEVLEEDKSKIAENLVIGNRHEDVRDEIPMGRCQISTETIVESAQRDYWQTNQPD
ncbi:V-type proton ATPase subunit C [Caenorhabditis elegans]|uniref:Isoform b of V-type proton ATPase subunit C n=1 Tax=Caenorhabditis elegans TaxID=6239 RepID=Q9XXU9-2|nr:V-type proton ATPase subunit C [Caenorhabditis elegans]CCD66968.1 V-type proton ATPase subunit C [Caenorhabditis elegans]|eukprot:NP_001023452.1 V-type proton ATPase subunit C [Caenorhabditis elegans]